MVCWPTFPEASAGIECPDKGIKYQLHHNTSTRMIVVPLQTLAMSRFSVYLGPSCLQQPIALSLDHFSLKVSEIVSIWRWIQHQLISQISAGEYSVPVTMLFMIHHSYSQEYFGTVWLVPRHNLESWRSHHVWVIKLLDVRCLYQSYVASKTQCIMPISIWWPSRHELRYTPVCVGQPPQFNMIIHSLDTKFIVKIGKI